MGLDSTIRQDLKRIIADFPETPGIYKMLNVEGDIIYVGKAKNLKKRVSSYFLKKGSHDFKTHILVAQIHHIETMVTATESEALVLESQLVKTYQPKYNIQLKDDKSYPFIKITQREPFPKVVVVRERKKDGAKYYGPYPSIGSTKALQRMLLELFPIRDCKQPIGLTRLEPKCLLLDIGRCIGPCVNKGIKPEYDRLIQQLHLFLTGQRKSVLAHFKEKMKHHADALEFELAASYRDKLEKVTRLWEKQSVHLDSEETLLVVGMYTHEDMVYVLLQEIIEGRLLYQHGFYEAKSNPSDFLEQCVVHFLSETERQFNAVICSAEHHGRLATLMLGISPCISPKRGVKTDLVAQAQRNAKMALLRVMKETHRKKKEEAILHQMKTVLGLKRLPFRVFGFDISHTQGKNMVASAVSFVDGLPEKKEYRKFNINGLEQSNDPESIRQAVTRRLTLCLEKQEPLPDLLVIDGGIGQLHTAIQAVASLQLLPLIDIISIAKKDERLYLAHDKQVIHLKKRDPILQLIQRIRDESHRFANTFQALKRRNNALESVLMEIDGVGLQRLKKLYQHYKSVSEIEKETPETLAKTANIPRNLAAKIVEFLKNK